MYTKKQFAGELLQKLEQNLTPQEISHWAYQVYLDRVREFEPGLETVVMELVAIDEGSQFEYTIEELYQLAYQLSPQSSYEISEKSLLSPAETKIEDLLKTLRAYHVYTSSNPAAIFGIDLAPVPWLKYHKHPQIVLSPELPISDFKGFSIYCTPRENPGGKLWERLHQKGGYWERETQMTLALKLLKPSSRLAECTWVLSENNDDIVALTVRTAAYALYNDRLVSKKTSQNRSEDIAWVKHKIKWLWKESLPGVQLPKIKKIEHIELDDEHFEFYDMISR